MERWLVAVTIGLVALALVPAPAARAASGIDLAPDVRPVTATPGIATPLAVYALNRGAQSYTGDVDVAAYVDGALLQTMRIAVDAETITNATFVPSPGLHRIELRIDTSNEVPETNESDDTLAYDALFTTDPPDLAVDVPAVRARGWPDTRTEIDVRVCNVGRGDSGAPTLIGGALFPDANVPVSGSLGTRFATKVSALAPGACLTHTFRDVEHEWLGQGRYEFHASGAFDGTTPVVFEPTYDDNAARGTILYSPALAV